MGFLSPLFLVGLLAGAVPILLHLFRQQAGPEVPFSAVRYIPHVPMHRSRRRQVQDVLLLALRVAAVTLLTVSFARPYLIADPHRQAPITVIAIDRSYSMSAPGRMARAHALARQAIDDAAPGDLVAVLGFDERAEIVLPPTADRSGARRAASGISSGFGPTRFDAALEAAAELVGDRTGRLVFVTDLQAGGMRGGGMAGVPETLTIEALSVGPTPDNLLVSAVRRSRDGVSAEVRSSAAAARTVRIALSIDGVLSAERRMTVPAGGTAEASFALALPGRAAARVSVEDETGYTADDVRFAVLDPLPPRYVAVVVNPGSERDALYLGRAIAAAEGPDGVTVETVAADAIVSRGALFESCAAVVVLGSRGFDARAGAIVEAALARGSGLLLVAGGSLDWPWLAGQLPSAARLKANGVETATAPVSLAPTEIRHPVFHASGADTGWVGAARFGRHLRLSVDAGWRVLARFTNGAPALIEANSGSGRVLVFASDLANQWNDFALQPSFVPFVHALVQHVAGVPPPLRDVHVGGRPGAEWARPGIVEQASEPLTRAAVNVDLRESDGAQLTPEAFAAAVVRNGPAWTAAPRHVAQVHEREQSWWWYGLLLMLIGLLIEGAVGRGRRVGAHA